MSEHFNEHEVKELKDAFLLFDTDNDGKISASDVSQLAGKLGMPLNSDVTLKGSIDFAGFLSVMSKRTDKTLNDKEADYKAAFATFDKDNKGNLSADDIARVLQSVNQSLSATEIEEIVKYADVSGDGMISYEEFVKLMVEGI